MAVVTVEKALQLWDEALQTQVHKTKIIAVKAAKGYVLAEDIMASTDVPAFPKSAMDGYAIAYEENRNEYIVDGVIGAGVVWECPVEPGHAVRIMTGAPVPDTCDTVIMQEQVVGSGEPGTTITIQGKYKCGDHIIPQGEECCAGTIVIPRGTEVTSTVQTILNRAMICGLLEDLGFHKITHYHVSDAPEELESEINHVLKLSEEADIIISSGGVSVGLFDTMPLIYEKLGAKSIYARIQMRPGAASYGAVTPKGQIIFGLSGNPGAAFNGWHLIVAPTLKRYKGLANWTTPVVACVMDSEIFKRNAFDRYVQGKVIFGGGAPRFVANRHFNSSSMLGLYTVNALACIPKGIHEVHPGDTFDVYLLGLLPAI